MGKILVIEDDSKILRILKLQLERQNHIVYLEENGIDALNNIDKNREFYDLVLLDLGLPGMEGNILCEKIRKISTVPIIILSARSSVEDKVHLLKSGASDYVTKPFDILELCARIDINIRKEKNTELIYENIILNTDNYSVTINKELVSFTKTEYELLKLLIENNENIVSRNKIVEKVWGWEASDNLIDSTMKKLRQKIGKENIKTVRGIGYILKYEKI